MRLQRKGRDSNESSVCTISYRVGPSAAVMTPGMKHTIIGKKRSLMGPPELASMSLVFAALTKIVGLNLRKTSDKPAAI